MSGAPVGNSNAANAKVAKAALMRALENKSKVMGKQMLEAIWEAQIDRALQGERDSAQLIIERLDGKPKQELDAQVNGNIVLEIVRFADTTSE